MKRERPMSHPLQLRASSGEGSSPPPPTPVTRRTMDIFLYDKMMNCQDVGRGCPLLISHLPYHSSSTMCRPTARWHHSCIGTLLCSWPVGISTILMLVVHLPRAVRRAMQKSLGILEDAIRLFGPECVYASFNGGKDAVVILHLCE
jgi:hypothetical protein